MLNIPLRNNSEQKQSLLLISKKKELFRFQNHSDRTFPPQHHFPTPDRLVMLMRLQAASSPCLFSISVVCCHRFSTHPLMIRVKLCRHLVLVGELGLLASNQLFFSFFFFKFFYNFFCNSAPFSLKATTAHKICRKMTYLSGTMSTYDQRVKS